MGGSDGLERGRLGAACRKVGDRGGDDGRVSKRVPQVRMGGEDFCGMMRIE